MPFGGSARAQPSSQPAIFEKDQDAAATEKKSEANDDRKRVRGCLKRQSNVHAIDGGHHGGDAEEDGEGCEALDGFVHIVGEDDLVRVAQAADAFDVHAAEIFGLANGDEEIFEEVEVFFVEVDVALGGEGFEEVAHGDEGGEVLVENLFIFREDENGIAIDDAGGLFVEKDGVADPFDAGGEFLRDAEENVEKQFGFLGRGDIELHDEKRVDDFACVGRDGDEVGVGENNGEELGMESEFLFSGVARKEDDGVSLALDAGDLVFVEAVANIGEVEGGDLGDLVEIFWRGFFSVDPRAGANILDLFECRVSDRFKIDLNHICQDASTGNNFPHSIIENCLVFAFDSLHKLKYPLQLFEGSVHENTAILLKKKKKMFCCF